MELAPWLTEGVNRVVVMHIGTDCQELGLRCASELHSKLAYSWPVIYCVMMQSWSHTVFLTGFKEALQGRPMILVLLAGLT